MTRFWGAAMVWAATVGVAAAQPVDGPYVGLGGGVNFQQPYTEQAEFAGFGSGQKYKIDSDVGFAGLGSAGWGFGSSGWRVEVEGNFRQNGIDQIRFPASGGLPAQTFKVTGDDVRTYGVMGNVLFDFDIGSPYIFPYVGAGAGYAWTDVAGGSDRIGRFAAQGIFGSSLPIPGVPGLSATLEYRFFALPGSSTDTTDAGTRFETSTKRGQRFNHSGLVGLRYAFNVAPPPVADVPAEATPIAAASRNYLIFFDWDRATLTTRARQIVKEASDNVSKTAVTRIEVNGYTDTSGTPRYNQGLSVRRAEAVKAELLRDGVPQAAIVIQGFGETKLLVPTASGVREPQNRRVEIILR